MLSTDSADYTDKVRVKAVDQYSIRHLFNLTVGEQRRLIKNSGIAVSKNEVGTIPSSNGR